MSEPIINKVAARMGKIMEDTHVRVNEEVFPADGLTRRNWKKLNLTQDTSMMDSLLFKYGTGRTSQWVLDNTQKDAEER